MALVPVRSKDSVNGEKFVTEVSEEWLARWPEDFDRLEGDELLRHELTKAGVAGVDLDEAVQAAAALSEAGAENPVPLTSDELDATVSDEPSAAPDATA